MSNQPDFETRLLQAAGTFFGVLVLLLALGSVFVWRTFP